MKYYKYLLVLAAFLLLVNSCIDQQQKHPPNILFILVDDLGWKDLGSYGSEFYDTPNLDELTQQGVRFTNAYSAHPVRSEEHTSELQSRFDLVCRLLLE